MLASRPNNAAKNYCIFSFRHCLDSNHNPFDYQAAAMTTIPWCTIKWFDRKQSNQHHFFPCEYKHVSDRTPLWQTDSRKANERMEFRTRKMCFIVFASVWIWTINLRIGRPFLWPLYHQVITLYTTFHWQPTHTEKCRRSNPRLPFNGPPRPGSGRGSDIMNCLVYNPLENGIMNIKFLPVKEVVWSYAAVKN